MCDEIWYQPLPSDPRYSISSHGDVLSFVRENKPRQLKTKLGKDGYLLANVSCRWRRVHHLVLEAFIGPRPDGMETRHLNGNPLDNCVDNLAWDDHATNLLDKRAHGTDRNAIKTHCAKGHPYDKDNTYWRADRPGSRSCRACNRERKRLAAEEERYLREMVMSP